MSLRNFHVDANVTDAQLLAQSEDIVSRFARAFRVSAANGGFRFGGIELKDPDLVRVHDVVNEIDSRRVFYACGEDENPRHAMTSLYAARDEIRKLTRGLWADKSCERLVQEISNTLSDHCTRAERLRPEEQGLWSPDSREFMSVMTDMRLTVWVLVAVLQRKLGGVISPSHLPIPIALAVERAEV
ncbi:hypothetical protein [Caenimonas koreensis]|uniref:hypothetical protein n=1 Tax=Caenimonas koreensis TaxID=367474 RepID=UPI0037851AC0